MTGALILSDPQSISHQQSSSGYDPCALWRDQVCQRASTVSLGHLEQVHVADLDHGSEGREYGYDTTGGDHRHGCEPRLAGRLLPGERTKVAGAKYALRGMHDLSAWRSVSRRWSVLKSLVVRNGGCGQRWRPLGSRRGNHRPPRSKPSLPAGARGRRRTGLTRSRSLGSWLSGQMRGGPFHMQNEAFSEL